MIYYKDRKILTISMLKTSMFYIYVKRERGNIFFLMRKIKFDFVILKGFLLLPFKTLENLKPSNLTNVFPHK